MAKKEERGESMLNHIVIMGRLTRDPELRRTGSGIAVVSFNVAVERDFAEKQSGQKETDFIDCVAWRQTGEFVSKYFTKGRVIVVSGRLRIRNYTDKDGNKRRSAEIVADNCYFGDSKKDADGTPGGGNAYGGYNAPAAGTYTPPAASYGGSAYPEAEAALNRYGAQRGYSAPAYQQDNFVMLADDDAQLPF